MTFTGPVQICTSNIFKLLFDMRPPAGPRGPPNGVGGGLKIMDYGFWA
jgi:hypothetical protein